MAPFPEQTKGEVLACEYGEAIIPGDNHFRVQKANDENVRSKEFLFPVQRVMKNKDRNRIKSILSEVFPGPDQVEQWKGESDHG